MKLWSRPGSDADLIYSLGWIWLILIHRQSKSCMTNSLCVCVCDDCIPNTRRIVIFKRYTNKHNYRRTN
jgi:hypothetical protein